MVLQSMKNARAPVPRAVPGPLNPGHSPWDPRAWVLAPRSVARLAHSARRYVLALESAPPGPPPNERRSGRLLAGAAASRSGAGAASTAQASVGCKHQSSGAWQVEGQRGVSPVRNVHVKGNQSLFAFPAESRGLPTGVIVTSQPALVFGARTKDLAERKTLEQVQLVRRTFTLSSAVELTNAEQTVEKETATPCQQIAGKGCNISTPRHADLLCGCSTPRRSEGRLTTTDHWRLRLTRLVQRLTRSRRT